VDEDGVLTADGVASNPAGVLDNDTGAVEASLVSGPSSGSLSLAADGTFTYTPDANFFGEDGFSYVANDGAGGPNSNVGVVSIAVNAVPDSPVAMADGYEVVEGETLNVAAPGVLVNDSDPDGEALSAQNQTVPSMGVVDAFPGDGSFVFNATGLGAGVIATFDYDACDPGSQCSTATVTVKVVAAPPPPENAVPVARDDSASTPRNTPVVIDVVSNDVDTDGIDPTSVIITTGTARGTVVNNLDGTVTYTPPNPGFSGVETFQYTVKDNNGATSNTATVTITVVK
jgi:hypothetical protein